jgi:predicted esterase
MSRHPGPDPHGNQPVLHAGATLDAARSVLILLHGRGASAHDMLSLFQELKFDGLAAVAPQAAANTWYPHSFLAPIESNQPFLDSALARIESIVTDLLARQFTSDRIALLGFSQGACLTSEFVARHPRRYGAVMVLTGGLIGPPGTPRNYVSSLTNSLTRSLTGTPVFLGSGDPDPHVPFARVLETESVFQSIGATVEVRRYPGRPHSISEDELAVCRAMLQEIKSISPRSFSA